MYNKTLTLESSSVYLHETLWIKELFLQILQKAIFSH